MTGNKTARGTRVLLFSEANMNAIDGSSVWTQSAALALAASGVCDVTLLLLAPIQTTRLLEPLFEHDAITVVDPFDAPVMEDLAGTLSPYQVRKIANSGALGFVPDVLVVRGSRTAADVAKHKNRFQLWSYLTDVPQTVDQFEHSSMTTTTATLRGSDVILCQTESLRSLFEQIDPESVGKCWVFPPILPEAGFARAEGPAHGPIRLVYAGKFAVAWNTLEMTTLPAACANQGIPVELRMVGDKIERVRGFRSAMRVALESTPGVKWHGGVSREEAMRVSADSDIGLSWRNQDMSLSRELSTKVLEYCALGVPPILNRSPLHEELLGRDYPLYAETIEDVIARIKYIARRPRRIVDLAERARAATEPFSLGAAAERTRALFERQFPHRSQPQSTKPIATLLMSHDLKFFSRIQDDLDRNPAVSLQLDRWRALAEHDVAASRAAMDAASVIICEWCGPNAVFASSHVRSNQRLIVRLHRFELYSGYTADVDIDAVDTVVTVSPYYRDLTLDKTGWPPHKVVVIPNWVDTSQLRRAKIGDVRNNLGFIGMAPRRKRFDRALDVLAELRRHDPRYHLFVKSKLPWDLWWIWNDSAERSHYAEAFRRIQRDPLLQGAVTFDPFGPDVGRWLQKIGYVLSTSDDESFHLAPAEGMASGAVPSIIAWPGADTIYDPRWIAADTTDMADFIATTAESWTDLSAQAKVDVERYSLDTVLSAWTDLVLNPRLEFAH